jgi:N6-L-threonylcarbamoyladenine synthase
MRILGIETSCDETAAAVVENGTVVLSNVIASQIALHQKTGGVVPEVAAREHVLKIIPVIEAALAAAARARGEITSLMSGIDAIAVTQGPGLLSSLVIGTTAASTLATYFNKPLIPVNHIAGHIYANWLDENPADPIQFPLIILTVSGGHNELVLMRSHAQFQLLGETLDDAAGEAFDKVARLLNLGYPGGPAISKVAEEGDPHAISFPRAYLSPNSYDFSFSGLKTAVLNKVMSERKQHQELSPQFINNCAASFQDSVCQILSDKLLRAAEQYQVKEVHLAGGVSANKHLRAVVTQKINQQYYLDHHNRRVKIAVSPRLRWPQKISYCTDNAAMIAAAAYFHYQKSPNYRLTPAGIVEQSNAPMLADPGLNLYHAHRA